MKKVFAILVSLSLVLFVAGCSKKVVVQPEDNAATTKAADDAAAAAAKKAAADKAAADAAAAAAQTPAPAPASAAAPAAPAPVVENLFKDINFDYDKYVIMDKDKVTLKELSKWLISNKSGAVLVEGNCDERGTNEYNLALGDKRANSAKDFLTSSGVPASRVRTVSYGEEKPLCTDHSEECWARNRRDHFVITGAN